MRVLLIGSGADAVKAREWDLSNWTVCAINAAWSIVPDELDFHIKSGDWIPPVELRVPFDLYRGKTRPISYREYDAEYLHEKFGKQDVGIGSTMFFNAAYWILGHLADTRVLGFIGCSMFYPNGEANTFYGSGTPDPLRFDKKYLRDRFHKLEENSNKMGISLFNFGSVGIMPYRRSVFSPLHPPSPL